MEEQLWRRIVAMKNWGKRLFGTQIYADANEENRQTSILPDLQKRMWRFTKTASIVLGIFLAAWMTLSEDRIVRRSRFCELQVAASVLESFLRCVMDVSPRESEPGVAVEVLHPSLSGKMKAFQRQTNEAVSSPRSTF